LNTFTVKAILLIFDGLGDRPIKSLGGKTPLEAAKTPNFDKLAAGGVCGISDTLGVGLCPGSDTAHLSLFGYPLEDYYCGRGPFEAAGVGMKLAAGDVAFRANAGTVDAKLNILDRRAGRIRDTTQFAKAIDGMMIDGVKFRVKPATAYRMGVVMHGKGLSAALSDPDPHEVGVKVTQAKPLDDSKEAKFTAAVVNKFLEKSHKILKDLPFNKKREAAGEPPGNYVMLRGAGSMRPIPPFEERYGMKAACVAGAGLYKGAAALVGMKLLNAPGATGLPDTNVKSKFSTARKALKKFDFVFIHVKGADSLGEDKNIKGKKEFIEKCDRALPELMKLKDTIIAVTADHSTPCEMMKHSGDPVPIMFCGQGVRTDDVKKFGERACAKGGVGRIRGIDIMPEIVNLTGRAKLVGD